MMVVLNLSIDPLPIVSSYFLVLSISYDVNSMICSYACVLYKLLKLENSLIKFEEAVPLTLNTKLFTSVSIIN